MSKTDAVPLSDGRLAAYLHSEERRPLFLLGDSRQTLTSFPPSCIDCCMTSPPYWGQRAYWGEAWDWRKPAPSTWSACSESSPR